MSEVLIHAIVLVFYLLVMMGIGLHFYKKSNSQLDYYLGGRNLNAWVTSISAQASDMSGWLLMGLPGTAFLLTKNNGMSEAVWTAIGLAVGTYLNWLLLAKRLRKYSEHSSNSITIPTFLESRFKDQTHIIKLISAVFIVIFFLIYTAAQFSAGAKLFNTVFGLDYTVALIVGAIVIVSYTFLGGFLAVCWTDLIQGILMFLALIILPIIAINKLGGVDATMDIATGLSEITNSFGVNEWLGVSSFSLLTIISITAWGLGYFGQPHILSRFMGIKHSKDIKPARRIAIVWVVISLGAAVLIGIIGKAYMSTISSAEELANMDGEKIFIYLVQNILTGPGLAIIGGILLTAILAAIMSTADSQLLVTSSAISEDICKNIFKGLSEVKLVWISRLSVIVVALIALVLASDPNSSVFDLVAYAWAGFGAAFGPAILISLYWKRMNRQGALAGIVSGGIMVIVWRNFIKSYINLYEILPAFVVSVLMIIIVSLLTAEPEEAVTKEFDEYMDIDC